MRYSKNTKISQPSLVALMEKNLMYIEQRIEELSEQLNRIESLISGQAVTSNRRPLALDIKETAKMIGIGTTNTRKLYKSGILKGYQEGKKIMIIMKSIEEFVEWDHNNKDRFKNL